MVTKEAGINEGKDNMIAFGLGNFNINLSRKIVCGKSDDYLGHLIT